MEAMEGGWKAEGKEKPVTPKICEGCQGFEKINQVLANEGEPDGLWILCETCRAEFMMGGPLRGIGTGKVLNPDGKTLEESVVARAVFG